MHIGSLQQRASPVLVGFVFACIGVITLLLYFTTGTEDIANNWLAQTATGVTP